MCARAMLNCGLERLRLVAPRDGWPNDRAVATSADADRVIAGVECFGSVEEAVADCARVFATTDIFAPLTKRRDVDFDDLESKV